MIKTEEPEKISAGSAMATSGWWLGFGGGKALALPFVQLLQEAGIVNAWQSGYLALTVIVILCIMGVIFFIRVPAVPHPRRRHKNPWRCERSSCMPIPSCLLSAAIPCRWRYCCYFLSSFSKSARRFWDVCRWCFTKKSGSPKTEIGLLSGGLGTITVCVFSILGSFVNARYGLLKGLFLGGIAMAATNLFLAALAIWPSKELFAVAVVADQFTTAVSTVAFVAFLSQLCDRAYTATQYAALASIGNLSRTTLASGFIVDGLGGNWAIFFVLTTIMVLPSLALLFITKKRIAPLMDARQRGFCKNRRKRQEFYFFLRRQEI